MKTFMQWMENLDPAATGVAADRASEEKELSYFIQEITDWLNQKIKEIEINSYKNAQASPEYTYRQDPTYKFLNHLKSLAEQHDILTFQKEISRWLNQNKIPPPRRYRQDSTNFALTQQLQQSFKLINNHIKNIVRMSGQWPYKQSEVVQNIINRMEAEGDYQLNPSTPEKAKQVAKIWLPDGGRIFVNVEQINPSIYKIISKKINNRTEEWYFVNITWTDKNGKKNTDWTIYDSAGKFKT